MPRPPLVNSSHGREDLTPQYIFPNCAPAVALFTRRGIQDPAEMLAAMQACRKAMVKAVTESTMTGEADKAAEAVIESLDDLVEELTGKRDSLWKGPGQR
jgi:hypothetical protein